MTQETPRADVDLVAEVLGGRRNGLASDGRGWYRTADDRADCYADAAAVLAALDLPSRDALVRAETWKSARAVVQSMGFMASDALLRATMEGFQREIVTRLSVAEAALRIELESVGGPAVRPVDATAEPVGTPRPRCPSRIAHESGVVLGCQRHRTVHSTVAGVVWDDDDDRVITGTPTHHRPDPARGQAERNAASDDVQPRPILTLDDDWRPTIPAHWTRQCDAPDCTGHPEETPHAT